jgi:hypothetical protein
MHSWLLWLLLTTTTSLPAKGVYQEPDAFLNEVFNGEPPAPEILWITRTLRDPIEEILGHAPGVLRMRYWKKNQRSAWILEEIGKEQPITVGFVVNTGRLETVRVLAFRESRGWEVRYPFFTDQFNGATLTDKRTLDRTIDGISGATLSVRALRKLARLALFLDTQTAPSNDAP